MVSRSEVVAYKPNAEAVFLMNFSRQLFLQAQRTELSARRKYREFPQMAEI